jgi:hypothetical protein
MAKIEIQNLTRSTFWFPAFRTIAGGKGEKPEIVADPDRDIVIGDRANNDELKEANPDVVFDRRCPPAVVTVEQSQIDSLVPNVRKVFDALVAGDPVRKIRPSLKLQAA